MTLLVALRGLVAARSGVRIAGPIDLDLRSGEALIVTGENGAGKSTLLRTLAGLLPPGGGTVSVEGSSIDSGAARDGEPPSRLSEIAHYLGHRNGMKSGLSVGENLLFWRRFLQGSGEAPIETALAAVGLPGTRSTLFGYLSAGQQRRAAIARLLVVPRPVWILDEPTGALDAASQALFAGLLSRHLSSGGIVLAATHQPLGIAARSLRLERNEAPSAFAEAELAAAEGWS